MGGTGHDVGLYGSNLGLPSAETTQNSESSLVAFFKVDARDANGFDLATITQFSNDDYLAIYYQEGKEVCRAFYQSVDQKVAVGVHDTSAGEIQLGYVQYDPLNASVNVARMVSAEFTGHVQQAVLCLAQPSGHCESGFINVNEDHKSYQPYTSHSVYFPPVLEESSGATRIIMDGELVTIARDGKATYHRTHAPGKQGESSKKTSSEGNSQPSTASGASGTSTRVFSVTPVPTGQASSSGGSGDDDDPEKQNNRKVPDDYQEPARSESPRLTQTQIAYYRQLINAVLNFGINDRVSVDSVIVDYLLRFSSHPRRLYQALRQDMIERFGINEGDLINFDDRAELAISHASRTPDFSGRGRQDSYFTVLLNTYLAEIERHPNRLSDTDLATVSDLLSLYYGHILAARYTPAIFREIGEGEFCLPPGLKEIKDDGGCMGANCFLPAFCAPRNLAHGVRTVFGTHTAITSFSFLLISYFYFNADNLFGPDVEADEVLGLLFSVLSNGASLIASVLNSASSYGVLSMAPNIHWQEIALLVLLNSMKDTFSMAGLFFGMLKPEEPEYLRLCQIFNGVFGAAFASYLLRTTGRVLSAGADSGQDRGQDSTTLNNDSLTGQPPLLRWTDIKLFILFTGGLEATFRLLGHFSDFQPNQNNLLSTAASSGAYNLAFPRADYLDALRMGAWAANVFVGLLLYRQHQAVNHIVTQESPATAETRQAVEDIRRPLYVRAGVGIFTTLMSFMDRYGNNPLSYLVIPAADTAKSMYFESAVALLREQVIAEHIFRGETHRLEQSFNDAVSNVEYQDGMTVESFMQALLDKLEEAGISTQWGRALWLQGVIGRDYEQLESILNRARLNANRDGTATHFVSGGDGARMPVRDDLFTPQQPEDEDSPEAACSSEQGACGYTPAPPEEQGNLQGIPLTPVGEAKKTTQEGQSHQPKAFIVTAVEEKPESSPKPEPDDDDTKEGEPLISKEEPDD
ncbi:hypothetical protein [Endozoicomonas lisbonensis]